MSITDSRPTPPRAPVGVVHLDRHARPAQTLPHGEPTKGVEPLPLPAPTPRALSDAQVRTVRNVLDRLDRSTGSKAVATKATAGHQQRTNTPGRAETGRQSICFWAPVCDGPKWSA